MTFIRLILAAFLLATQIIAAPEFPKGSVILDDEAETILQDWLQSLFLAADLKTLKPQVIFVSDPEINAAALPGGRVLINTGLILEAQNAAQVLGVLAHEVGHIASAHRSPLDAAFNEALVPAAVSVLIGGLTTALTGDPSALAAGLMGGTHVMERTFLRFSRIQEVSADQAAFQYLEKLNWPASGLLEFFKILETKSPLFLKQISRYAMTHPLTSERISATENHIRLSQKNFKIPSKVETDFQCLKAKFSGFLLPLATIFNQYKQNDFSIPARYAQAIAFYRQGDTKKSVDYLDQLIKESPQNPYFSELKGQVLFDAGKIPSAIENLKIALNYRRKSFTISLLLAHALIESKNPQQLDDALKLLIPISQKNADNVFVWRLLATVYGQKNNLGMAALSLAEEAFLKKEISFALNQANRAKKLLQPSSQGHLRAEDLIRLIKKLSAQSF